MIIQLLLTPINALLLGLLDLMPSLPTLPDWIGDLTSLISLGLVLVPRDVWLAFVGVHVFWRVALPGWAVVEWIYHKIPGVT